MEPNKRWGFRVVGLYKYIKHVDRLPFTWKMMWTRHIKVFCGKATCYKSGAFYCIDIKS